MVFMAQQLFIDRRIGFEAGISRLWRDATLCWHNESHEILVPAGDVELISVTSIWGQDCDGVLPIAVAVEPGESGLTQKSIRDKLLNLQGSRTTSRRTIFVSSRKPLKINLAYEVQGCCS